MRSRTTFEDLEVKGDGKVDTEFLSFVGMLWEGDVNGIWMSQEVRING